MPAPNQSELLLFMEKLPDAVKDFEMGNYSPEALVSGKQ